MEFKIANKAKLLTLILMLLGAVSLIIGVIADMNSEHLVQRLLVNGLTNGFFFFALALGAFFFLTLQYATESGWYASVKRVIEAQAGFLPFGAAFLALALLIITFMDGAHIYIWMDKDIVAGDPIIQAKSFYLNKGFFWVRTLIYLGVYLYFWKTFKARSLEEDRVGGTELHFKNYRQGALFLVFFAVFSSMSSWDWLMSVDVHWFSTLYGWYTFSGMWCSAMVVTVLTILYLKKLGYLPKVNENHIHDIGKWVFATSFLWSYLFFSQYMLIWYANIPEEVTYYITRTQDFKFIYFFMFIINFAFPMLILMSRDAKRHAGILSFVGLVILMGHWLDVWIMISAGSMGKNAHIGFMEVGMAVLMSGVFIRVLLVNLTKAPLTPVNHPFLDESIHHEI